MKFDDALLKKILLDGGYVTQEDMSSSEKYASEHRASILEYLFSEDLISATIVGQAIAEHFGVPYVDLGAHRPTKEQVMRIPEETALKFRVLFLKENKVSVNIATDHPDCDGLDKALAPIFSDKKIRCSYCLSEDLDAAFSMYRQALETRFAKIFEAGGKVAPEIVDQIIDDALLLKASDVHIEPREREAVVRFRIDGVLHDAGTIPREFVESIINRLKIQAKMRIDEHFGAQDGAIRYAQKDTGLNVDLRVSVIPTLDGEKVAIRILSAYVRDLTMGDIGLSETLQRQIDRSSKKPFGMILVTGPTGSGKTTTLYSLIKQLNTKRVNITTIEDPVEYKIEGVNQIQVNAQANLTFAKGLRAVVRQDPNVIFVGEIRDLETADISVNAALTGHLLLSTFHANNAATSIPRFVDMGVEPFLVSSVIELVIAQRLVRKICSSCRVSYTPSDSELDAYDPEVRKMLGKDVSTLYRGKGCDSCSGTGFKGRIGVFEFIATTPELQDLISKHPSTKEIMELVQSQGFVSMFEDGLEKVRSGTTSLEELVRVVSPS